MADILVAIHTNSALWIACAFIFGLVLKIVGMPPLIGFLAAGFALNALGVESGELLNSIADLGITLLLFSIGLKLRLQSLAKPEVWGVASIHMVLMTLAFSAFVMALAYVGLPLFTDLDLQASLLIGFVLSFSSTVFAIKILDELGAMGSKHGQVAIGVLVVQDIAAVAFLAVLGGKVPSIWALALISLVALRPMLGWLLNKVGHGELLVLFGIVIALCGADLFELVGVKGDVGALVFGMLMASHNKASELAKALLGFKELFLVGFFLTVGMTAMPGWTELLVALIFLVLLPLKVAAYFLLFNGFYLRSGTSWRTALNLANYSEFGLIVGALAASSGLLPPEWLAVFAITLALSFILSAPLVNVRDSLYQRWRTYLHSLERHRRVLEEQDLDLSNIRIIIFGMGRMGSAAYETMDVYFHDGIAGVEIDSAKAHKHQAQGRRVVSGDATNPDFWVRAKGLLEGLDWVMLTLPSHAANMAAAKRLHEMGYGGKIAATSKFPDEEQQLKDIGVDFAFNIYTEAGLGFANNLTELVNFSRAKA